MQTIHTEDRFPDV